MTSDVYIRFENLAADILNGFRPKVTLSYPGVASIEVDSGGLRELMVDRPALLVTLVQCFVQPRVFTEDLEAEILGEVKGRADLTYNQLDARVVELSKRGGSGNRLHLELLLQWQTLSKRLRDSIGTRILALGSDKLAVSDDQASCKALLDYRVGALPIVDALVVALPTNLRDPIKEEITHARDVLPLPERRAVDEAWQTR
ncbi:hypothetical protein [Burkholderia sp. Ax-1724]|uniref:hypothetical protein n=1 Tax=Burkholderia sp. Ax-1724 TaxID=2608336 RepID=UPI0014235099|nr:hypothetical protein [Burkholderia sp. Ax-1724]NIF56680.1 hypothetical protein [Burkholderia sp. Ax-1724]